MTVSFLTETNGTVQRTFQVAPTARLTVAAGLIPELVNRSFAMVVDSNVPIVAERAMYFGTARFWDGGHESAGVSEPSASLVPGGRRDRLVLRHVRPRRQPEPDADRRRA